MKLEGRRQKTKRIIDAELVLLELQNLLEQRLSDDPRLSHIDAGILTDTVLLAFEDKDGKPQGNRELIDDLARIPWEGRQVYICYDSDTAANPSVRSAEWYLAETLQRHKATVRVVRLPAGEPGPDGTPAKNGLDDFLIGQGTDAFRHLLTAAVEPTPPEKGLTPNEAGDDPHRLARIFTLVKGALGGSSLWIKFGQPLPSTAAGRFRHPEPAPTNQPSFSSRFGVVLMVNLLGSRPRRTSDR